MKTTLLFSLTLLFTLSTATLSRAEESLSFETLSTPILLTGTPVHWKVGDTAEFSVSAAGLGNLGKMTDTATKDEGAAIWIHEDMNLSVQKQTSDRLVNKADGKILRRIVNGEEQPVTDDKMVVISEDLQAITVPAGTFQSHHWIGKNSQIARIEQWDGLADDPVMSGTTFKLIIKNGGTVEITFLLVSYHYSRD